MQDAVGYYGIYDSGRIKTYHSQKTYFRGERVGLMALDSFRSFDSGAENRPSKLSGEECHSEDALRITK